MRCKYWNKSKVRSKRQILKSESFEEETLNEILTQAAGQNRSSANTECHLLQETRCILHRRTRLHKREHLQNQATYTKDAMIYIKALNCKQSKQKKTWNLENDFLCFQRNDSRRPRIIQA